MLDSLYTEAIMKKSLLNDFADDIFDKNLDIDEMWIGEEIAESGNDFILSAGDGSFNKKKFIGFNFYAVAAESLIYVPNSKDRLRSVESVELDILPHHAFVEDRLRNMMSIFEVKTALKAFNQELIDYYMDDGSLLGDLIRPMPLENGLPSSFSIDVISRIHDNLKREINDKDVKISSLKFKEEFQELFDEKVNENALISYLENIERLLAMNELLNHKEKIIAVSKTSTSNDIFHTNVPDMAIFDRFTQGEGYSKPYYKKVDSEVKRDFPIRNTFFRNLWFTIFFVRLEKNSNIIKIELPYYAIEDDVKKIIGIMKSNSTDGYPYLLKKAHNDVVIRHKDMQSLSNIIEFLEKSGREMLD